MSKKLLLPAVVSLLILAPLTEADEEHPHAALIRREEGRVYDIVRAAGAPDVARARIDFLIVHARNHYRDLHLHFPWADVAPPEVSRGRESVRLPMWFNAQGMTVGVVEQTQEGIMEALRRARNPDAKKELERWKTRIKEVRELFVNRLDRDIQRIARQVQVTDLFFSEGVDSYDSLVAKAREADLRIERIPARRRNAAFDQSKEVWIRMERLVLEPDRRAQLDACRKMLEEANEDGAEQGILLVRRTFRMERIGAEPVPGKPSGTVTFDVQDTVRIHIGNRETITGLVDAYQRERERTKNGAWHWGVNPAGRPARTQFVYKTTVAWIGEGLDEDGEETIPAAVNAERIYAKIMRQQESGDVGWFGPLNGYSEDIPPPNIPGH